MIDAVAYSAWLERVRPLTAYLAAVVAAAVLARAAPAIAVPVVLAASIVAPLVVAVRGRGTAATVLFGPAGPRAALLTAATVAVAAAALALGALRWAHGGLPAWSLFGAPPPPQRGVLLALAVPNAIAAAVVFQGWLQTKLALVLGRWGAALATVAVYALADRNPFVFIVALAPAVARAENGSLLACCCAYAAFGLVVALAR